MHIDRTTLAQLLRDPREAFDTELKRWIDPASPEGISKIAKACIALRNNNGGCLIVGFKDTGDPDLEHRPDDVRNQFAQDNIQWIIARYASESFEIQVEFIERDGAEYPIICVPSGVTTPVCAKSDLTSLGLGEDRKNLITANVVYARTLSSNNVVSTSAARPQDWDRIMRHCFDNREADIGSFVRRHLTNVDISGVADFLRVSAPSPTPYELAEQFLGTGRERFKARWKDKPAPPCGVREAAIVIDGNVPNHSADIEFKQTLMVRTPGQSRRSLFKDITRPDDEFGAANVFLGGWESLSVFFDPGQVWGRWLEFWRIEPSGRFYCMSGYEEDLCNPGLRDLRGIQLSFPLQIARVAETISIGLSFARAMGCDENGCKLAFAFRWNKLNDRWLSSWGDEQRGFYWSSAQCNDDDVTTTVTVPLETPISAIGQHVDRATKKLFQAFGGESIPLPIIEEIVNKRLSQ
jgi:hypothetical protein